MNTAHTKSTKLASPTDAMFWRFLDHVTRLCDQIYAKHDNNASTRTSYHLEDIELVRNMIPEDSCTGEGNAAESFQRTTERSETLETSQYGALRDQIAAEIAAFSRDADES